MVMTAVDPFEIELEEAIQHGLGVGGHHGGGGGEREVGKENRGTSFVEPWQFAVEPVERWRLDFCIGVILALGGVDTHELPSLVSESVVELVGEVLFVGGTV